MSNEEPSYLAFARANAREGLSSSPVVVRGLLERIDRDGSALEASRRTIKELEAITKPRMIESAEELDALPVGSLLLSCSKYPSYVGTVWRVSNGGMIEKVGREAEGVTPVRYFKDPLPVTVLHEGAAK